MIWAAWVKIRGAPVSPVPSTMLVLPDPRIMIWLIAVAPTVTEPRTCARQFTVIVMPGGMSSFQVRIVVLAPVTTTPGVAAAHPDGVIVQPWHGSSNPNPCPHVSSCAGTVSHTLTSHHVLVDDRFLRKIE